LSAQQEDWGRFDRLAVTQKFLDAVYPDLRTSEGLIILRSQAFHAGGGPPDEIDVVRCRPGSGMYGGFVPGAPPPLPHCAGLYPDGPSRFLSIEVGFWRQYPIRFFSAGGSFFGSQIVPVQKEVAAHPEWSEEEMLEVLHRVNPQFGHEHQQEFLRTVPVEAIRRFTGCKLQFSTAVLYVSRAEAPPDPPQVGVAWRIYGHYLYGPKSHNTCIARFEPFEGKLISVGEF